MTGNNSFRSVVARAIIFYKNKLLVVRHADDETGQPVEYWATPGGRIELDESIVECLKREIYEETAIRPKIGKLLFIQQFTNEKGIEKLEFFFLINNPQDYQKIDLTKTSHGLIEIAEIGFRDADSIKHLPTFLTNKNLKQQIETDCPVKIFYQNKLLT